MAAIRTLRCVVEWVPAAYV